MRWMTETPVGVVYDHARAIPRLEAHESSVTAERVAVGSGTLKPYAARQIQRRWQQEGRAPGAPRTRRRAAPAEPGALAALGITVIDTP